ncbi:RipA family octameric membrane protein [Streptomyces sp. BBFR2]|uniref:RipA family octameric membrane protein n=1 Tax=Streptomyces sp. BBFR2 TaxID=3372854 RepID=UPI0037D99BB0
MTGIDESLWNADIGPSHYSGSEQTYQGAVLEQYKLCVEMADRVSSRRNLTNTFFLTLNTAVVAAAAAGGGVTGGHFSVWVRLAGLVILLTQCLAWFVTMRSYRQLNAAKFAVIGALERKLPALAYSDAEWGALGEGRDWRRYLPLTYVEQWVPSIFAVAYVVGFLATVA